MTTRVQGGSVTWARSTQGTAKTITLPAAATVGNVVTIEISYTSDVISSVTGLGATWSVIRSRESSSNEFPSAEIWYCTVATAGTTITITPNSAFTINSGKANASEWVGLTGSVGSSATQSSQTSASTRSTSSSLSAAAGDVYVGVITQTFGTTPSSTSQSPSSFTTFDSVDNNYGGGSPTNWMISGARIATGSETPSLTGTWSSSNNGIVVAAVFTATATVAGDATLTAASTLTVDAVVTRPGVATLAAASSLQVVASTQGNVALAAASSLTPTGVVTALASASFTAASSLTTSGAAHTVVRLTAPPAITMYAPNPEVTGYAIDRSAGVITLTLDSTEVPDQPGALHGTVGNGTPGGTAYFFIDASTVSVASAVMDDAGTVIGVAIPVDGLTAGTHTVYVGEAEGVPTSIGVDFITNTDAATTTLPTPAEPPTPDTTRWTFQAATWDDPMAIPTYEFASNPSQVTETRGELELTVQGTTAANGVMTVWEGAPRPGSWSWTGRVLTKYDHDALVWWSDFNGRVWLTDEYRRRFLIKIENVKFTRKRNMLAPWDQEYQMQATILETPSTQPLRYYL